MKIYRLDEAVFNLKYVTEGRYDVSIQIDSAVNFKFSNLILSKSWFLKISS